MPRLFLLLPLFIAAATPAVSSDAHAGAALPVSHYSVGWLSLEVGATSNFYDYTALEAGINANWLPTRWLHVGGGLSFISNSLAIDNANEQLDLHGFYGMVGHHWSLGSNHLVVGVSLGELDMVGSFYFSGANSSAFAIGGYAEYVIPFSSLMGVSLRLNSRSLVFELVPVTFFSLTAGLTLGL